MLLLPVVAVVAASCVTDARPSSCGEDDVTIQVLLTADELRPDDPAVCRDQAVTLIIDSAMDGYLHIHGYDEVVPIIQVVAGEPGDASSSPPIAAASSRSSSIRTTTRQGVSVGIFTVHEPLGRASRLAASVADRAGDRARGRIGPRDRRRDSSCPCPLWLYLLGAAVAVAASFVVIGGRRPRSGAGAAPTRRSSGPHRWPPCCAVVLRNLGLAWWYGAIVVGFVVGDISPLPAVLLWIGIWVGLPIARWSLGNPWPSLSPFRTTFGGARVARATRSASNGSTSGLRYPRGLARWPAVVLFAAGVWGELILPGSAVATTVAALMIGVHPAHPRRDGRSSARSSGCATRELFEVRARLVRAHRPVAPAVDEPRAVRRLRGGVLDRIGASTARSARPRPRMASAAPELRCVVRRPHRTGSAPAGRMRPSSSSSSPASPTTGCARRRSGPRCSSALLTPITDALGVTSFAFLLTDTRRARPRRGRLRRRVRCDRWR